MTPIDKLGMGELLARVKAATGPDRELDLDIAAALFTDGEDTAWWQRRKERFLSSHMLVDAAPPYTASIDAALALTERMLPGRSYHVARHSLVKTPFFVAAIGSRSGPPQEGTHEASAPLAILAALLTSLSTKEG
jgi:hypothetical protein